MKTEPGNASVTRVALAAASYLLWLITAGLGLVDVVLIRRLLLETAYALDVNPWTLGAIDKFGLVILGIVWLVLVWLYEARYREAAGVSLAKLLRRFARVTGAELALAGLSVLIVFLLS